MIMDWVCILAYINGTVDQELLLRNKYLAAENRILKAQLATALRVAGELLFLWQCVYTANQCFFNQRCFGNDQDEIGWW